MTDPTPASAGPSRDDASPVVFADAEAIRAAVERVADGVARTLSGPVVAVPILSGALYFAADLLRALAAREARGARFRLEGYSAAVISSYGDATEPLSAPRVLAFPPAAALRGRTALLVDTVMDRGATLAAARERAVAAGAHAVRIACLVDKPARRAARLAPDWAGLVAPDVFLVGYGLDAAGRHRTLPWLGVIPAAAR